MLHANDPNTKTLALSFALQHHARDNAITGSATIVATAQTFEQYLNGGLDKAPAMPVKTEVLANPAPKPIKETKAPTAAKKPAKTEEQMAAETLAADRAAESAKDAAEAASGESVSADEVKGVIEALLKANKRKDLVALFGKYKAKSFSSIPEDQWAAFHTEASDILMSA